MVVGTPSLLELRYFVVVADKNSALHFQFRLFRHDDGGWVRVRVGSMHTRIGVEGHRTSSTEQQQTFFLVGPLFSVPAAWTRARTNE